jgi:hypothetical protein
VRLVGGSNRWGDYSATVVDPTDPNRFWTIQEIAIGNNNWGMQITELILAPVPIPEPSTIALFGIATFGFVVLRRRRKAA